jgi:steroid delta-isomerase
MHGDPAEPHGEHPAIAAARASWRCVRDRARAEWLALLADDVTIEDPIGVSPTNPTGSGLRGRAGAEQFWDANIARTESIRVQVHESFAAGDESAHVLTLVTRFPSGVSMSVHGVFTYALDAAGKIRSLRGYWSLSDAVIQRPG